MKQSWLQKTIPIATILSFRMLGLFMLIPIFTVYATNLTGTTPKLLGIALGCYGLSQGILQIPFGILSDRFGRKPIIAIGLILFAIGSLLGAYTHSIYGMIFARILQGAGAIGSVLMALLADSTPDEHRTKAMAVIGVTIGLSFSLAMVISPAIAHYFGLSGIFYLTTIFALIGLLINFMIPSPIKIVLNNNTSVNASRFKAAIRNRHLQRLDAGIFFLHLILTSTFFAIPQLLQKNINNGQLSTAWHFYLPLMLASFIMMIPCITYAEKKQKVKLVFSTAVGIIALAQGILAFTYSSFFNLCIGMFLYFVAFNVLEATLPSLVSKQANPQNRGSAMGIYSSSQFLGIFFGGAISGILFQHVGYIGIFAVNSVIAILWLIITFYMQPQQYQLILTIPYPDTKIDATPISSLPGVTEMTVNVKEQVIYICVEKSLYQNGSAELILGLKKNN